MSCFDLTCHNYRFVAQYRHNDGVYLVTCVSVLKGSQQEHLCQHSPGHSPESSDSVKYIQTVSPDESNLELGEGSPSSF